MPTPNQVVAMTPRYAKCSKCGQNVLHFNDILSSMQIYSVVCKMSSFKPSKLYHNGDIYIYLSFHCFWHADYKGYIKVFVNVTGLWLQNGIKLSSGHY